MCIWRLGGSAGAVLQRAPAFPLACTAALHVARTGARLDAPDYAAQARFGESREACYYEFLALAGDSCGGHVYLFVIGGLQEGFLAGRKACSARHTGGLGMPTTRANC